MLSALVIKIRNERGGFPASLCVPGVNACGTVCVAHTFCYIWKIEAFPPTKKKDSFTRNEKVCPSWLYDPEQIISNPSARFSSRHMTNSCFPVVP